MLFCELCLHSRYRKQIKILIVDIFPGWARTWGNAPWAGWWTPGSANWGAGGRNLRGAWGPGGPRSSWTVPRQGKFSR